MPAEDPFREAMMVFLGGLAALTAGFVVNLATLDALPSDSSLKTALNLFLMSLPLLSGAFVVMAATRNAPWVPIMHWDRVITAAGAGLAVTGIRHCLTRGAGMTILAQPSPAWFFYGSILVSFMYVTMTLRRVGRLRSARAQAMRDA